ncbi:hypothetical protein [Cupriavidus sp. TMH.W2]|uniref:hypothetical protein n=1 Tax=Cupriavidus sp. TMH.W2 TaxID=3434465 RepID=UPI003D77DFA8
MADDLISRGVAADWVMQFKQAVRVESTKYIDQSMADLRHVFSMLAVEPFLH